MDYTHLAYEVMEIMKVFKKRNMHKQFHESMHGEIYTLYYVYQHEGNVIPSDISNKTGVSTARVAATLNSLEKKGMVIRKIDPSDRRRILVEMTPAGKKEIEEHIKKITDSTINMLSYLGEDDAKEYVRIMKRLADRNPEDCI
ncbi:MAG: winged helix-turn-helix transcriptional regulator [Clostridiales bacterium]|nr:winged helix-turn-helix transcriptional regulator [Clostridiales bacterium]